MKNNLKTIIVLLSTVVLVLTLSYCNKSNSERLTSENQSDGQGLIEKSKAMQEHILEFKTRMEFYRDNPDLKSGEEKIQIDATILDWEATINFTYCYTYLELSDIIEYDVVLNIPLINGDSITIANASDKYYNNILETIKDKFIETDYADKKLMCVDLEPVNGGDSLHINIFVGLEDNNVPPLYDWYYGKTLGVCGTNLFQLKWDAALIIGSEVRDHFYEAPPVNCRWYFIDNIDYIDYGEYSTTNPDD